MTYGLDRGLFIEDGPAIHAAHSAAVRPTVRFRKWRALDSERRLAAIERAMKSPANDFVDPYPVAL